MFVLNNWYRLGSTHDFFTSKLNSTSCERKARAMLSWYVYLLVLIFAFLIFVLCSDCRRATHILLNWVIPIKIMMHFYFLHWVVGLFNTWMSCSAMNKDNHNPVLWIIVNGVAWHTALCIWLVLGRKCMRSSCASLVELHRITYCTTSATTDLIILVARCCACSPPLRVWRGTLRMRSQENLYARISSSLGWCQNLVIYQFLRFP